MNYSKFNIINDYVQYLASEYIANDISDEMTIREFVEAEVETCDAVTNEILDECYSNMEDAVEEIAELVEETVEVMVNNQK